MARADAYLAPLRAALVAQADPAAAVPMQRYMRDQFPFLGIKAAPRRALVRHFLQAEGLPEPAELPAIIQTLWAWPAREYQYSALDLLDRMEPRLGREWADHAARLITTKPWWDTVDALASHTVGGLFLRYPILHESHLPRWRQSENLWLRRTTLLFQLRYKARTDSPLLFALIKENLPSDEFFIQKAIGWALREYAKTEPAAVRAFVATTDLPPLSRREALKHIGAP